MATIATLVRRIDSADRGFARSAAKSAGIPSNPIGFRAPQWINPRKLSPRQQVQFYYLAMLRRSGENGHPRQPTQTPYEYARTLESQLPDIDQDVDGITVEFIEARYSRHDIPAGAGRRGAPLLGAASSMVVGESAFPHFTDLR